MYQFYCHSVKKNSDDTVKLSYNKLGYNKLSIITKKKIIGFVHYNREKLLVKLREQTNHFFVRNNNQEFVITEFVITKFGSI